MGFNPSQLFKKTAGKSEQKKKATDLDECKMSQLHQLIKDGNTAEEIAKIMKVDVKTIKKLMVGYAESYEIGTDEYREYLERLTPGEGENVKEGSKEEYQKFFNAAMKKFKIDSPADLKSDEEKKKFFDYVDKNYTGEKDEEMIHLAKEFKVSSMKAALAKVWGVDEKTKKENDDKEIKGGKTLTGKKAASVDIDPDLDEKKKKKSGNPHY